jgi:DNA-binding NarL/FixJ family response regulator
VVANLAASNTSTAYDTVAPSPDGTATSTIRIAAVDESEIVLRGLEAVLSSEPGIELTVRATSVGELVAALRAAREAQSRPLDGVIFSAAASRRDTVARCHELREATGPGPFLCVLSPTPDEQLLLDVTHAGVRGFLVRNIAASAVASAIRYLASGECYVDPGLAATLFELVRAEPDHSLDQLTATERAILVRMGEGLTNAEIAQQVFLSEKTVRNYISRILRKLGLSSRVEAVALGARRGRRHVDEQLVSLA